MKTNFPLLLAILLLFAHCSQPADTNATENEVPKLEVAAVPVAGVQATVATPIETKQEFYQPTDTLWVTFDLFKLALPGHEVYENQTTFISTDTLKTFIDLVESFDAQEVIVYALQGVQFDSVVVSESYRTTLSIMDEGPHLDMYDWKGHESGWLPVARVGNGTFRTRTITTKESEQFPEFTKAELIVAANNYGEGTWGEHIRKPDYGTWTDAYWIGVGLRRLKVDVYSAGEKETRVLLVYLPMGC